MWSPRNKPWQLTEAYVTLTRLWVTASYRDTSRSVRAHNNALTQSTSRPQAVISRAAYRQTRRLNVVQIGCYIVNKLYLHICDSLLPTPPRSSNNIHDIRAMSVTTSRHLAMMRGLRRVPPQRHLADMWRSYSITAAAAAEKTRVWA